MPFELISTPPRRIAVIGGGITGLAAAWRLRNTHHVALFEAEPRPGGHARTVLAGRNGDQPVDTGFIVFNRVNYPHLVALFEELGVPIADSDMSFGASFDAGRLEYGLRDMATIFAQRRNALRPAFLRMIRDILRFNARARATVRPDQGLGDLLDALGTGPWFRDRYITPLSGAIWSTPAADILDFPAETFVRFFDNHALLHHTGQHQWLTVRGGSREYIARMADGLDRAGVDLRTGAPVTAIRRHADGVEVTARGGTPEGFDEVILATHSDVSLGMLADADGDERAALSACRYQSNTMTLHADPGVMPVRRAVWSAWNYREGPRGRTGPIDLTYWMNALQPIPKQDPLFVTLNAAPDAIDPARVYDQTTFAHPVYDAPAEAGRAALRRLQGVRRTWFAGAWMRDGFHEDGFASAVDVTDAIARRDRAMAA